MLMMQFEEKHNNEMSVDCTKKTKADFTRNEIGRVVLGTAKEMAEWVVLGLEEQNERKRTDQPFFQYYIDLSGCELYISYPIDSKTPTSQIFNLCDMAGVVPGIDKIEGDPNYLFEVKLDIHLDKSVLHGNFFHYVKFDGRVNMDETEVINTFSCFKCVFNGPVYMQGIQLKGGFTFEQCEFKQGLIMSKANAGSINAHFNNCIVKEGLSLRGASFVNQRIENYPQRIELTNSTVDNLSISGVDTHEIPFYIEKTSIHGMKMHDMKIEGSLGFYSCDLDGFITLVKDKNKDNNRIKELAFHCCNIRGQYHLENADIDKLSLTFDKIEDNGRFRMFQCNIDELTIGSTSVYGQMDVIDNKISSVDLEGTCVHGYLQSQDNDVQKYDNRQTIRLLKNEAKKVNDDVSAIYLYAQEMQMLLEDKGVSWRDKISLRFSKWFSSFGENWLKALWVTLLFSLVLTLLMLGFGSGKYMFDPTGEYISVGSFVTILLDSINVFSIPLFSDTVKAYDLNVVGQILYFLIKLVVAYGSYQLVVAFRKYGRG